MMITLPQISGKWFVENIDFGEEKKDALVSQADISTISGYSISSVQNVDKVPHLRHRNFSAVQRHVHKRSRYHGSVGYVHARIAEDVANPGLEGNRVTAHSCLARLIIEVYHQSDALSYSLGWRYSGRQHSGLFNTSTRNIPIRIQTSMAGVARSVFST